MTNSLVSEVLMSCNNDYCFFAELTKSCQKKKIGVFLCSKSKKALQTELDFQLLHLKIYNFCSFFCLEIYWRRKKKEIGFHV